MISNLVRVEGYFALLLKRVTSQLVVAFFPPEMDEERLEHKAIIYARATFANYVLSVAIAGTWLFDSLLA